MKAHPAHPRLSARLAEIAGEAMAGAGVTTGPFGIVHGFDAGTRLVSHPAVRAVGFTGSLTGGLALWRLAASRPEVIPVYAEMGTVNTVVVTPSAAAERPAEIAAGFVSSFTLGMGQFCTKPGLLLAPAGSGLAEETGRALAAAAPDGWLLTEAIAGAYHSGLDRLASAGGRVVAQLPAAPAGWAGTPTVLAVDAAALTSGSPLLEECFGPVALVAEYGSEAELASVLAALPGSLAAGVHAAGEDDPQLAGLVAALSRWVRPVAFQDVPATALPMALRDGNPWRVPRRVDGVAA